MMQPADFAAGRHYGLDWLRIGAFGLLILYHIGMYFVSWGWHVKSTDPVPQVELAMLAINPWRLALLFLISGIASRIMLGKLQGGGQFARQRTARLLLPLIAGIVLFVAPQAWVELRVKTDYVAGFWSFWRNDYFEFGASRGLVLPTYNHLWFVAYLWVYTMALALGAMAPAAVRSAAQQGFDRLFSGKRAILLPIAWLIAARVALYPRFGETHALVDDFYNHSVYAFAFFFGAGLARSTPVWTALVERWKAAALIAAAGYVGYVYIVYSYPDDGPAALGILAKVGRSSQAWGAIVALLALAQLRLCRDGPARRYLSEAVFPFYIAHQTIIVLVGYWLLPLHLGAGREFGILLVATVAGCLLTFEAGRRVNWVRPFVGLRRVAKEPAATLTLATG